MIYSADVERRKDEGETVPAHSLHKLYLATMRLWKPISPAKKTGQQTKSNPTGRRVPALHCSSQDICGKEYWSHALLVHRSQQNLLSFKWRAENIVLEPFLPQHQRHVTPKNMYVVLGHVRTQQPPQAWCTMCVCVSVLPSGLYLSMNAGTLRIFVHAFRPRNASLSHVYSLPAMHCLFIWQRLRTSEFRPCFE